MPHLQAHRVISLTCRILLEITSTHSFFKKIYLSIIYFYLHWVFVAVCRLSLVVASGGYSSLQCEGFSLRWLLVAEHGLWTRGLQ